MSKLFWQVIGGLALLIVLGLVVSSLYTRHKTNQATGHQQEADIADGQAQAHIGAAQTIPEHAAEIQAAEAKAAAAEAKAATAEARAALAKHERDAALAKLAAQPATVSDARDEVITKDKVLIEAQAAHIDSLTT